MAIALVVAGLAAGCMAERARRPPRRHPPRSRPPRPRRRPSRPRASLPRRRRSGSSLPGSSRRRTSSASSSFATASRWRPSRGHHRPTRTRTSSPDRPTPTRSPRRRTISSRLGSTRAPRRLVPPLRAARLDGTFSIATRFTSKTGYGEYTRPSYGRRFVPRCRQGACNVGWRDIHDRSFRSRLERRGPRRYSGTHTGQIGMECGTAPMTTTIVLDLRVVAAEAIEGEWVATKLRGTIDQTDPAQLGCRSGAATLAVRARLARNERGYRPSCASSWSSARRCPPTAACRSRPSAWAAPSTEPAAAASPYDAHTARHPFPCLRRR